ncbi:MAG: membrane assembly protein AsmA [Bacteroidia bacterium]|nr:membrane assembly protein AsmA [Bacteroidia bacterium]
MGKFIKYTAVGILVLIGGLIAVPFLFKDKLIQLAKNEANKQINGKLNWRSVNVTIIKSFPKLGFELNDFTLIGVNEFATDTLISLSKLQVNLDIMSVIKGEQMRVHSIVLNKPRINVIILKNGKANYDITKPDSSKTVAEKSEPAKFKMALQKFEIVDGYINYNDMQGNMLAVINDLDHQLTGDFTQDVFDIVSTTEIAQLTYQMGGVNYLSGAKFGTNFNANIDIKQSKYTFTQNEFRLNALVFGLDGFMTMPTESITMDLKFNSKKATFKEFLSLVPGIYTKDFDKVKTSGSLAFNGYAKGTYNDILKQMPAFALDLTVKNGYFKYPSLPKDVKNINIDVHIKNPNGVPDNTVIDVKQFHVEMAGNPVDLRMLVSSPVSDPTIDGSIKGKIVLASVKDFIPLDSTKLTGTIVADVTMKGSKSMIDKKQYEAFKAAGNMSISDMKYESKSLTYVVNIKKCDFKFNPKTIDLTAFDAMLGENDIQGTGQLNNFLGYALKDDLLQGTFNATSTLMNINQFMEEPTTTAGKTVVEEKPMTVIPVPTNLDFTLITNFKTVLYDKMTMQNVKGIIVIKDAIVTLKDIAMNTLDGTLKLNGTYNTQDLRNPKVTMDLDVQNFDLPKTFATFNTVQKLVPAAKYATGKVSTILKFNTVLKQDMTPDLNSLTGNGQLKTTDVIVSGTPTLVKIADALKQESFKKLAVGNTNLTYEFADGRVIIKPFDVINKDSKINIKGEQFFDQRVAYTIHFDMPRADLGSAANGVINGFISQANSKGANVSMSERITFDALIGGTFTNPTVKTGLKDAAKGAVTKLIDDAKEKAKAELEKQKAILEAKAREEADKLKAQGQQKLDEEKAKLKAQADAEKAKLEADAKAEADRLKKEAADKAKNTVKGLFGPK